MSAYRLVCYPEYHEAVCRPTDEDFPRKSYGMDILCISDSVLKVVGNDIEWHVNIPKLTTGGCINVRDANDKPGMDETTDAPSRFVKAINPPSILLIICLYRMLQCRDSVVV